MVGPIIVIIFFSLILVGSIIMFRLSVKANKALKQKAADLGASDSFACMHHEGLGIADKAMCEVFRCDDKIIIDARSHKFEIQLNQLRAAVVKSEQELIEKGKSVVGRAVIGTLLVPGLGTIIGGMSGIGNKKKKGQINYYMIFNYTDQAGELKAVTFKNNFNVSRMNKFCNGINQSLHTFSTNEAIQL
ncbi:hypothetical protein E0485_14570 [Paenibacillus albiflavus]|uniref:Uncharacterized protein n=1 Tax=Paenibacillus albiflavus TaxID=2545760 RepID=A0A4R4EA25_9BACL|nr:hypothetical protein [Paenibacillus albiflavus]TCZ76067.1 hypothetical protein E0485_14570 [Paenibacillus albiflavus]